MRTICTLDIGTNSVQYIVTRISDTGDLEDLADGGRITHLGQGLNQSGVLSPAAMEATLEAVKDYLAKGRTVGSKEVFAVATSAVRDAGNAAFFLDKLAEETGIRPTVISGEREAEITFVAALYGLNLTGNNVAVIDVGGGSTEFITGYQGRIDRRTSLDLGSSRLTEQFFPHLPPSSEQVIQALQHTRRLLDTSSLVMPSSSLVTFVGVGGTVTTMASLLQKLTSYDRKKVHGFVIHQEQVRELVAYFSKRTREEAELLPGMEPGRGRVMLAGCSILQQAMEYLAQEKVLVSAWGLRHGLLLNSIPKG